MKDKSCTPRQAEGISGEHEESDEIASGSGHLWQPLSLAFYPESKERQFKRVVYHSWLALDLAGHSTGCIVGPGLAFSLRAVLPGWYMCIWLFISFGFALPNVYIFLKHRDLYVKHRVWSILVVRLAINLNLAVMSIYLPAPESSFLELFSMILSKSPVASMLYTALVHRVEFRHHLVIHTFSLIEAMLWIPPFCQTCSSHPGIAEKFQQVGYGIDWFFSYTFLGVLPDTADYPCWMITVLIMIVIAFVVPTFLVFVTEVSSRSVFLLSRLSSKFQLTVSSYANEAFRVALLASLAATVSTWFFLCLIRNALTV